MLATAHGSGVAELEDTIAATDKCEAAIVSARELLSSSDPGAAQKAKAAVIFAFNQVRF